MAVRSAVELGIFNIFAKAGDEGVKLSAQDIASQIGSKNSEAPNMLDRLLRLLASHSMLACSLSEDDEHGLGSPKRLYSLTPASKYFVSDADGVTLGHTLNLTTDKVSITSWAELKAAILEGGIPFNRVYGVDAFEYQSVDPRFNEVFNNGVEHVGGDMFENVPNGDAISLKFCLKEQLLPKLLSKVTSS